MTYIKQLKFSKEAIKELIESRQRLKKAKALLRKIASKVLI